VGEDEWHLGNAPDNERAILLGINSRWAEKWYTKQTTV